MDTDEAAADSRLGIIEAGIRQFAHRGFDGTTMRDIATQAGLRAGSLYHHFASKEELFLAAHAAAIARLRGSVLGAVDAAADPWQQLDQAARGYLDCMLRQPALASIIIVEATGCRPDPEVAAAVLAQRRSFEQPFADIVGRLPLAAGVDRTAFRLALLGMLAWTHTWWRADGRDAPAAVAGKIVALLRQANGPA